MAKAILKENRGDERDYQIPNGDIITLKLGEDNHEITYWDNTNKQLGSDQDFVFLEDEFNPNRFLLARMYVPIKRSGLGRASIDFFKDVYNAIIYTRPDDGNTRNDGSHLTEDAPGFVMTMIKEGFIEDPYEGYDDQEEYDNDNY